MNNIDILEDYIELIEKGYCEDCNELCNISTAPAYPSKAVAQAISTLIAENKELKETVEKRNDKIYELLDRSINALKLTNKEEVKQDYIPKSKVEAKIEQLDYNDIGNFERRCKREVLQELLGKE